jgi:hypothetical protein
VAVMVMVSLAVPVSVTVASAASTLATEELMIKLVVPDPVTPVPVADNKPDASLKLTEIVDGAKVSVTLRPLIAVAVPLVIVAVGGALIATLLPPQATNPAGCVAANAVVPKFAVKPPELSWLSADGSLARRRRTKQPCLPSATSAWRSHWHGQSGQYTGGFVGTEAVLR